MDTDKQCGRAKGGGGWVEVGKVDNSVNNKKCK